MQAFVLVMGAISFGSVAIGYWQENKEVQEAKQWRRAERRAKKEALVVAHEDFTSRKKIS